MRSKRACNNHLHHQCCPRRKWEDAAGHFSPRWYSSYHVEQQLLLLARSHRPRYVALPLSHLVVLVFASLPMDLHSLALTAPWLFSSLRDALLISLPAISSTRKDISSFFSFLFSFTFLFNNLAA
ncbi:hypothetical protein AtNW77_Chr3g0207451 [Arabidopsis thaliana]|uniref:Bifunctional inhibitor/lipid-transfer protein/seed storage 2S albumin superfamily protein n=1 Tax=Arabidopsis thaliana TaxID=3702 RepID=F4J5R8_ARATH|nr:Bifunctional inhibitor/lipid-transfer protein/seed storage 2S albumin superfamily protein [Arabidopsis thaliana]AEE78898.2 Bifunctional inhibitor/lipid-transfer protein/seed storage 2S albumin superfamily protein [Arabidopsis thaliana]|eukprot:NP_001319728.1 Bifunctional inhibitor/lipid-transfer protein/seed storage 2S albumin superfamily protein [Arabidopsis thaliana]